MVEIRFILFLFYCDLLMGEFTHADGQGETLAFALEDIFSLTKSYDCGHFWFARLL
jgi:hypothetical protein